MPPFESMWARPSAQLADVGGEVLVDEGLVGEVDDEGFVITIRRLDQIECGGVHCRTLVAHGAGIVDEDAHRHRNVLVLEGSDGLRHAVFEDFEVVLGEVVDQLSGFI